MPNTPRRDIKSYDIYDRGYRSGAQAQLFIGPIWVDEAVSFQIKTGTNDQPLYSYSGVYHDRALLGRYTAYGMLAINYVEPDYLLRIMQQARSTSIQEEELKALIETRKSVFQNTLRYKTLTEPLLNEGSVDLNSEELAHLTSYVNRISREVETISFSGNRFDPQTFELTIIVGGLWDDSQSIEIYEDVKIVGTTKRIVNDDESVIELYEFLAKKKPERREVITIEQPRGNLSRGNLMQMAKEVSTQLIDSILEAPQIDVFQAHARTPLMTNTNRLAMAGLLHPRTRFYGQSASFIEMVYSLEYRLKYDTYYRTDSETGIEKETAIRSETGLKTYDAEGQEVNDAQPIYLRTPRQENGQYYFDNSYGALVSVDRELTAGHLCAIAPVERVSVTSKIGGSIVMPRYRRSEFDIGSFIPPMPVDPDSFTYTDRDTKILTMSTMWCCLTGMRATSAQSSSKRSSGSEDPAQPNYLTELAQPLYTFAYIDSLASTFTESTANCALSLAVPVYVDYLKLDSPSSSTRGKRAKEAYVEQDTEQRVTFVFNSSGRHIGTCEHHKDSEPSITGDSVTNTGDERFGESLIVAGADLCDVLDYVDPTSADIEDYSPQFFRLELDMHSPQLASDWNKCLYVEPFVFLQNNEVSITCTGGVHGVSVTEETGVPGNVYQKLAYLLKDREGNDDSCKCQFDFDWMTTDVTGYTTVGGKVIVDGVYFMNWDSENPNEYRCPTCGEMVDITDHGFSPRKAHVIWVMAIVPMHRHKEEAESKLQIVHDLNARGGRYVELYNLIRCDLLYHSRAKFNEHRPEGTFLQTAFNDIKIALYTAFENLINTFVDDKWDYAMPHRTNLDYVAGFIDGYGFTLNVNQILDQVLKCRFTEGSATKAGKGDPTLEDLLVEASGVGSGTSSPSIHAELGAVIRAAIDDRMDERGLTVYEEDGKGNIRFHRELITPATDVVAYGLTAAGYEDLVEIRSKNDAYRNGGTAPASEETPAATIVLGGYDVE